MTTPTIRDLCAALADDVDYLLACIQQGSSDSATLQEIADRVNAARPVAPQAPEVGSAAALATWLRKHSGQCFRLGRPDWAHMADRAADTLEEFSLGGWIVPTVEEAPPAPEPGEVGELVLSLRETAAKLDDDWYHASARIMRSAAALLSQQAAPAPAVVPAGVSELRGAHETCRLSGDCPDSGICWLDELPCSHYDNSDAIPLPQGGEGEGEA